METPDWLNERIENCKKENRHSDNCTFMKKYIQKFYFPMCTGEEVKDITFNYASDRKKACILLHQALTNKAFVDNIID